MEEEELRELFCAKISLEIKRFKQDIVRNDSEKVYANAYQIDCMINIYELLLEMSQKIGEKTLKILLVFPSLLAFLYDRWMKTEDSQTKEMWSCLVSSIKEMDQKYRVIEKGDNAA